MFRKLREPVNSLTHWAGAALALAGLIALLIVGWGTPAKVISLIVYGLSLVFLFSASATYHMVRVKDRPYRHLFSYRRNIYAVLCERVRRLLEVGYVEHHLVTG